MAPIGKCRFYQMENRSGVCLRSGFIFLASVVNRFSKSFSPHADLLMFVVMRPVIVSMVMIVGAVVVVMFMVVPVFVGMHMVMFMRVCTSVVSMLMSMGVGMLMVMGITVFMTLFP